MKLKLHHFLVPVFGTMKGRNTAPLTQMNLKAIQ